jgi:hypothetical protein
MFGHECTGVRQYRGVSDQPPGTHRRRRRRATAEAGAPPQRDAPRPGPEAAPGAAPSDAPRAERKAKRPRPGGDPVERGLHELVGAGRSQLGVDGALRGRDVNRPTEADIAEAEETVVIVRRNWQPPDKK